MADSKQEVYDFEPQPELEQQAFNSACEEFRNRFGSNDKTALLECVLFCAKASELFPSADVQLPVWAMRALGSAIQGYFRDEWETLDDAIFGSVKTGGRRSRPVVDKIQAAKHQLWFDIVVALKSDGLKGDLLWAEAADLIANELRRLRPYDKHLPPSPNTVRLQYYKMRKTNQPSIRAVLYRRNLSF